MHCQKTKVLLTLDNCTAHPKVTNLKAVELLFLPPNTTSKSQPCDMGIINNVKCHYRGTLLKRLIDYINEGNDFNNFKLTLLDAAIILKQAWEKVEPATIRNCFKEAGFQASEILDIEDQSHTWSSGIFGVDKSNHLIEGFIDSIPMLVRQNETFGLIWNKSLQPSDGRYEPGEHFCHTRESARKSVNGSVSFYRDGETGEKFAIKTLQDSDHFHSWEVKIGLVCSSPHLCAVYGVIVRDHKIHILLEHAGSELTKERSWIAKTPDRILAFAKQSFQALEDLHRYGYVHCDIKPDNIMIKKGKGEDFKVKLIDFGSCQPVGEILPPDAHTTRFYWSPEIWQSLKNGMTQKSEDLLLIALPETIPSGLRAVMRPCLAGKAEDRWSAQQAANQLDGDAMMQKALSNPKGENYKDLFQQLLRNQLAKTSSQSPSHHGPVSSVTSVIASSTKTEMHSKTDHPINFFAGSNIINEKQDMGLNLKPVGNKMGMDKKPFALLGAKRIGSSNNGKWPKPRKAVMKGPVQSKHIKQAQRCSTIGPQCSAVDSPEVLYISSDETMTCPPEQGLKRPEIERSVCLEKNQSDSVKNSDGKISLEEITQTKADCMRGIHREHNKITHCTIDSVTTDDLKFCVGNQLKTMSLTASDAAEERAFSCSALLVTLASQARSSNQPILGEPSVSCKTGQIFERDKSSMKPASSPFTPVTKSDCSDIVYSNASHHVIKETAENKETMAPLKFQRVSNATLAEEKASSSKSELWKKAETVVPKHQMSMNQQYILPKPSCRSEENDEEMEFVFQALETPKFTGKAEDILDNLCDMLDKDESKSISNDCVPKESEQSSVFNKCKPGDFKVSQAEIAGGTMDTDEGITVKSRSAFAVNSSQGGQICRKRISGFAETFVPAKIKARNLQCDVQKTEHLLPDFEKILPENS
ncbi:tigger transposable element-derived protein [Plakobranchus ocellatus]|uniref:Tigger transposable element-derived protein n=1 Tax=Plakobranchus ocellatus TaxID=259542 RepID=A0AAV4CYA0_9GAST|nr:tigger transposable element-derived protein [Plakobranchus ocellatus]